MSSGSTWSSFNYDLPFRFGEWSFASRRLRVLRHVCPLTEIVALQERPAPPDRPALPADHDGLLLISLPDRAVAPASDAAAELLRYRLKQYEHCYIDMSLGYAGYQAQFSAKTRSGMRRKVKKFMDAAGDGAYRRYSRPEDIEEFYRYARRVSELTYQERFLDCGLPDSQEFRAEMETRAATGGAAGFLLFDGDKPVSYLYVPIVDGVGVFAYLGYDPDYASRSVGTVLLWLALESLFQDGNCRFFDFTEGDSEHKRLFSTHRIACSHLLLLRKVWTNSLLVAIHRVCEAESKNIAGYLARAGIKSAVRTWLRRQRAAHTGKSS